LPLFQVSIMEKHCNSLMQIGGGQVGSNILLVALTGRSQAQGKQAAAAADFKVRLAKPVD
jgi:hypothetical protein